MSATALRNEAWRDRSGPWREPFLSLAHRHTRCGVGVIYLKLHQTD